MTLTDKHQAEKEEILPFLHAHQPEILLTMGAGDIELMADDLTAFLINEENH